MFAGSNSPVETKKMARDALRTVLKKSGSESPTDPPDSVYSFYDNTTDDPLSHVTMTTDQQDSKESSVERRDKLTLSSNAKLNRQKAMTPDPVNSADKKFSSGRPEEIFSDPETMPGENQDVVLRRSKSSKKGHKRSRSDMSWLNSVSKPQRNSRKGSEDILGTTEVDSGRNKIK